MTKKVNKTALLLIATAVCALAVFAFTDLYYHYYAIRSDLNYVFVALIAICFEVLFALSRRVKTTHPRLRTYLMAVPFCLVLIGVLGVAARIVGGTDHRYFYWAQVFTYIAFGMELLGYALFLFTVFSLRKKVFAVLCAIILAVNVTAITCWTVLDNSITDSAVNYEWALDAPEYNAPHLSRKYNCGVMTGDEYHDGTRGVSAETSYMQVASRTDKKAFNAYCEKLAAAGYAETGRSEIESITSRTYEKDGKMLHVYYNAKEKTARIVTDPVSVSPQAASYAYEVQAGDQVRVYQYALMSDDDCESGYTYGGGIERCGMNYVIKLADNKLIIIDGGEIWQASDSAVDGFYDLCKEISGVGADEKIEIAAWIGSHAHGDHIQFFSKFLARYASKITLERYLFNYPNWKEVANGNVDAKYALYKRLETYAPDAMKVKPHTGQTFTFAGTKLEILYTHEDAFNYHTNKSDVYDFNDSGMIFRFTFFDNTTFFVAADLSYFGTAFLQDTYTATTLKSDIIQAAHHGNNFIGDLYSVFHADYVFYPQGYDNAVLHENKKQGKNYDIIKKYTPEEHIYMMNRFTYGLIIYTDGTIEQDPVVRPYIGPDFANGEYFDGSLS